jgi:hypothetical protein
MKVIICTLLSVHNYMPIFVGLLACFVDAEENLLQKYALYLLCSNLGKYYG